MVVAQLWYPAASDEGERAPYIGRTPEEAQTVASGLAEYFGLPGFVLDQLALARTDAVLDAVAGPVALPGRALLAGSRERARAEHGVGGGAG